MKFSDLQNELLDVTQLTELKGGKLAPGVGCQSRVCSSAMETISKAICTTAAYSSRAA